MAADQEGVDAEVGDNTGRNARFNAVDDAGLNRVWWCLLRGQLLRWVAASAGVAVALVAAPGCGGGTAAPVPGSPPGPVQAGSLPSVDASGEGSGADAEIVRGAAGRTAAVGTATYRLEVFLTEPEGPVPLVQVEGVSDLAAQRSSLVIRQWLTPGSVAAAPDGDPTEVVIDANTVYLRSPALGAVAGTGDRWFAVRDGEGPPVGASSPQSVSGLLGVLAGVEVAAPDGSGEVAGVAVRWFVVDLGALEVAERGSGSPAPIGGFVAATDAAVVGVDGNGFVRMVELGVRDPLGAGGGDAAALPGPADAPVTLRLVFTELGVPVVVRVPGDGEVVAVP